MGINIQRIQKQYIVLFLFAVNVCILCLVGALYIKSTKGEQFLPITQDECTYYNSARIFGETNSVKAVTSVEGKRSVIGETHWYGPGYHVVYGCIMKLFGSNLSTFTGIHLIFFLISVIIAFMIPKGALDKQLFVMSYMSSYAAFAFIFTYFPETIIMVLNMLLLRLFLRVKDKQGFWIFIMAVFFVSFFRVTAVMWAVTLPFIKESQYSWKRSALLAIACVVAIFVFMKYFTAPAIAQGIASLHGEASNSIWSGMASIFANIKNNVKILYAYLYFHEFGLLSLCSLILLICMAIQSLVFQENMENQRRGWAILVMTVAVFGMFGSLYTFSLFYIEKQLAFLVPALIYVCLSAPKNRLLLAMVSIFLFLPFSYAKANKNIESRRESYKMALPYAKQIADVQEFPKYIQAGKKEVRVIFDPTEYNIPNGMILYFLPVSIGNTPVTYINPHWNDKDGMSRMISRFYKKDNVYILTVKEIKNPALKLIYKNATINLYDWQEK